MPTEYRQRVSPDRNLPPAVIDGLGSPSYGVHRGPTSHGRRRQAGTRSSGHQSPPRSPHRTTPVRRPSKAVDAHGVPETRTTGPQPPTSGLRRARKPVVRSPPRANVPRPPTTSRNPIPRSPHRTTPVRRPSKAVDAHGTPATRTTGTQPPTSELRRARKPVVQSPSRNIVPRSAPTSRNSVPRSPIPRSPHRATPVRRPSKAVDAHGAVPPLQLRSTGLQDPPHETSQVQLAHQPRTEPPSLNSPKSTA